MCFLRDVCHQNQVRASAQRCFRKILRPNCQFGWEWPLWNFALQYDFSPSRGGGEEQGKRGGGEGRDEKENRRGLRRGGEEDRKIGGWAELRRRAGE